MSSRLWHFQRCISEPRTLFNEHLPNTKHMFAAAWLAPHWPISRTWLGWRSYHARNNVTRLAEQKLPYHTPVLMSQIHQSHGTTVLAGPTQFPPKAYFMTSGWPSSLALFVSLAFLPILMNLIPKLPPSKIHMVHHCCHVNAMNITIFYSTVLNHHGALLNYWVSLSI